MLPCRLSVPVGLFLLAALCFCPAAYAQQAVPLVDDQAARTWAFGNGPEFPGATGSLALDDQAAREGRPSLKLTGDFSKGGNYVQAGRKIEGVDIRELAMWVRNGGAEKITLRINDATGQCHQISLRTEPAAAWQRIVLPLDRFFARRGQADAVPAIAKYESWGGAKDGLWHGPAQAIYILISPEQDRSQPRTLWINDLTITPGLAEVPGAEIRTTLPLDEVVEGTHDWRFTRGEEFAGAKGSLTLLPDQPEPGKSCFRLAGDFTGGGAYVAMVRKMKDLEAKEVRAIRVRLKSDNVRTMTLLLCDATGQAHQRKGIAVTADGAWHEMVIRPEEVAGGEHWGGANDGKWHGAPSELVFSITSGSDPKARQPVLLLADIRAEAMLSVFVQPAAFQCDFEGLTGLPPGWKAEGGASIDAKVPARGDAALMLARPVEDAEKLCTVASPAFPAAAGRWELALRCRSDLTSPDNSYNAVVSLECLDAAGKVLDRLTVADVFGKRDWQRVSKRVELPAGTASARFHARLNKTYGSFRIDDLSAAYLAPAPRRDERITRVLFSTAALGNLLLPDDPRRVDIQVEARKPLRESQRVLTCVLRDYWGAEQTRPVQVALGAMEKKGDRLIYRACLDLADAPLEVGRYYELHASLSQEGQEPFSNYTSLAILPDAPARKYKPQDVPFTSRNWDNRFSEYVKLSDRLGVRVCGIWGGWAPQPPYKPQAPALDLVQKLGMGWLTGTPCATIERGKSDYDEQALRQGVRNLIETFGKVRPMYVNLGNEPHGTGDCVVRNVKAYRAVYEEIKKVDPTIPVIATAVEPNEEYFRAGYGQWCDAYDFHIYESCAELRQAMAQYQALARKYGQVKPIWSTELGLNSQGMTRHAVACELIRKTATFFACGGTNMSWFGLLYPDPEAKLHGTSSNSHNLFDCRYNRYCPRLDAVAYYNAVNAVAGKKFLAEKQYPGTVRAFLFRDSGGSALQILWAEKGQHDLALPLACTNPVQVIRIDGSRRVLQPAGGTVCLTISQDPILLLYSGAAESLPDALPASPIRWENPPARLARGAAAALAVTVPSDRADQVELVAPAFWTVAREPAGPGQGGQVRFTLTPPPNSQARECDLTLRIGKEPAARSGELYCRCMID